MSLRPHALTVLRRVRQIETDVARRDLADILAELEAIAARAASVEQEVATARQVQDLTVRDSFVRWLDRMRLERARLTDQARDAEARAGAARMALAERRRAETVAEEALARAMAELGKEAAHREQIVLEDAARGFRRMV